MLWYTYSEIKLVTGCRLGGYPDHPIKGLINICSSGLTVILDFLYLIAKNYSKKEEIENVHNPKEKSNTSKSTIIDP
jgi:hypothetical protein